MKNNKHSRRNSKVEPKIPTDPKKGIKVSDWEDLLQVKDKLLNELTLQLGLLSNMYKTNENKISQELKDEIRDVCKGYNDIAKDIRETMNRHITFDKDNQMIDYKKGKIYDEDNEDGDDVFEYINIAGEYMDESSRIKGLAEHTNISILPKMGVYDDAMRDFETIKDKILKDEQGDDSDGK